MTYTRGFYWFLHKSTKAKQTNEEKCLQKAYKTETNGKTNKKRARSVDLLTRLERRGLKMKTVAAREEQERRLKRQGHEKRRM